MMLREKSALGAKLFALLLFLPVAALGQAGAPVAGTVTDEAGDPIPAAVVTLTGPGQAVAGSAVADGSGRFRVPHVAVGDYTLRAEAPGFGVYRAPLHVHESGADVGVRLSVAGIGEEVTVTAEAGRALSAGEVAQKVNVITRDQILERVDSVFVEVAEEEPGLNVQRTSPTMGGIFVRGLTGKNVAVYVDGVRMTTSAQRGGVSTFLNLTEPTSLEAVEVLRGPNSAQYGSDSLGGTVSILSRVPAFGSAEPAVHGELATFYSSAANAFGANTSLSYGGERFGLFANVAARRDNTIRTADGLDSHAAVTRFLGVPSDVLGTRLPDTAFTQYGGLFRFHYAPTATDQLAVHYQRGQQDGGKRYDQLLGGDGNLVADLRNLMLDLGFVRYTRAGAWVFDTASATASFNSEREERVNQGGQGNPAATITNQYERTTALGVALQLGRALGERVDVLLGVDAYREWVQAPAFSTSPVTGAVRASRPRIPDGARYLTGGVFAQGSVEAVPDRLRLSGAVRYGGASYRVRSSESPLVNGLPLFPDDSLRVSDVAGRFGVVASPWEAFRVSFNYSRGFRAPSVTDLGTLGLTGDGFEVAAADVAGLGGTVGSTAGGDAVSTGAPVTQLGSETSDNFDVGLHVSAGRVSAEVVGFVMTLGDAISKQALVLPAGSVGVSLGGEPVVRQDASGVVYVGASPSPVLVRSNFGTARLYGIEGELRARLTDRLGVEASFTKIRAYDVASGTPPNIEGGTPPATGSLSVRYAPAARFWVEAYATVADAQRRLSSLDLADRRTGARRTRSSVAAFFTYGARARGLVGPGADGAAGTADDVLLVTGETVGQVQARVLGGAEESFLFRALPGYGLAGVRGGVRLTERAQLFFDVENLFDKTYRNPSWGVDGPGRGMTVRYRYQF